MEAPIWLPAGMSFLSGLPTVVRKRRLLLPIQAFIDDSGGKGQGRSFVLAGLIGKAEDWAAFSEAWYRCLRRSPRIKYFKMYEAAKLKGQFANWKRSERDKKIKSLCRVLNRKEFWAIHCTCDLEAFQKFWEPHVSKPLSYPYFFPFHITIMSVCLDLVARGYTTERFEIIFDEQVIFGPKVKLWYPLIRDLMQPSDRIIMPIEPQFKNDCEFLPLQASDMIAWLFRRAMDSDRNPFQWITGHLKKIEMSPERSFLDASRMQEIVASSYKLKVAPEVIEAYRKKYDL